MMDFKDGAKHAIGQKELDNLCKWFKQEVLKSPCNYVVFCSKRMYSLALLLEQITGNKMDNRFITDCAIISVCEELASVYKATGSFPKILLVEDILDHGFSINTVIENIETRLKTFLADKSEDDLRSKFSESVSIRVYCYTGVEEKRDKKDLLIFRYLSDAKFYVKYESDKWRNLSYNLSTMLTIYGMQFPVYMPSMIISEDDLKKLPENEYSPVSFYNVDGYTKVELVTNKTSTVYAVLSLRFTKILNSEYYRVMPFVIMPNLDFDETMTLYKEIQKHISKENTSFINYLDSLCKVDGMRAFNEWISFILGQTLINEFCKKYNISQTSESKKDFEWNIKRLLRNYVNKDFVTYVTQNSILSNVTDLKDCILKSAYNRPISHLGSKVCDFQEELTRMEDYVYDLYCTNEQFANIYNGCLDLQIGYKCFENAFLVFNSIICDQTQEFAKDLLKTFLAIQDSWMIEITSCSTKRKRVVGYSQFIKPTLDTGLLLALRHRCSIGIFSEAYGFCRGFSLNLKDYLNEFFSFCKYSQKEKDDFFVFLKHLDIINQIIPDWNLHWHFYNNYEEFTKYSEERQKYHDDYLQFFEHYRNS